MNSTIIETTERESVKITSELVAKLVRSPRQLKVFLTNPSIHFSTMFFIPGSSRATVFVCGTIVSLVVSEMLASLGAPVKFYDKHANENFADNTGPNSLFVSRRRCLHM